MSGRTNRDDFTPATKRALASRSAWCCAFAGCGRATVGPKADSDAGVVNLGEAAHITAAAPDGPRHDPQLTREERRHISNGIWMCPHHARLVDADEGNYSVDTLRQWKRLAERVAYERLEQGRAPESLSEPETLVALGYRLVFSATWLGGSKTCWRFRVVKFVLGSVQLLRDEVAHASGTSPFGFVVVESQGDGRIVAGEVRWEQSEGGLVLEIPVEPRAERRSPDTLGADLALGPDGDLLPDLRIVDGNDAAVQHLTVSLGCAPGEPLWHPEFGSLASLYYWTFRTDLALLGRLIKLEVARLATVPISREEGPPLNFVWRVTDVRVTDAELQGDRLPVIVVLIWADGQRWNGVVRVFINRPDAFPKWLSDPSLPAQPFTHRVVGPTPSSTVLIDES